MRWTLTRARDILFETRSTWEEIKGESLSDAEIMAKYVAALALVPALAFYFRFFFSQGRVWIHFLSTGIFYALCLAIVRLAAQIFQAIASRMEAQAEPPDFLRLSAFSLTPAYLGSVFLLLPWLSGLTFIIAFYALYLLYVGIPILVRCPDEKILTFSVVSMAVLYGLFVVAYLIPRLLMVLF